MFHLAAFSTWVAGGVIGGTQVMIPVFDPVAVLTGVQEHAVTDLLLVPTMIQLVVDHPRVDEFDLTSVPAAALRRLPHVRRPARPHGQGPAQRPLPPGLRHDRARPAATVLTPEDHQDPTHRRSVGRAAPHTEVRVVGPDDAELPRREVGEVVVRGGNVMLGYWNRPEETAEALRGGWMHTATPAGWTTRATCTSPTASRT